MRSVLPALATELEKLKPVRRGLLVLGRRIVPVFAIGALQRDDLSGHDCLYPLLCCWRTLLTDLLLQDLADGSGAHGASTLADGEAQALFHCYRRDQLDGQ